MGWISALNLEGQTIWIVDAHGFGKRFIVRADEILTAFVELQRAIHEFAVSLIVETLCPAAVPPQNEGDLRFPAACVAIVDDIGGRNHPAIRQLETIVARSTGIADFGVPQPTEWQRIGNQIDAAFILPRGRTS